MAGCKACGASCGSSGLCGFCTTARVDAACAPTPNNAPITDAQYQCSIGVELQCTLDGARRIYHELGLRPYRVTLNWARRNSRQRFEIFKQIELTPVRVDAIQNVNWSMSDVGRDESGDLVLSEVSPQQVNDNDLRGRLDGEAVEDPDVSFWYEISRIPRCPSDAKIEPGRYTAVGLPGFDGEGWQYLVRLRAQNNTRLPEDTDQRDRDGTFRPATAPRRKGILR